MAGREPEALWTEALEGPNTDLLADRIVALARSWAGNDPERLREAGRILAGTPALGEVPREVTEIRFGPDRLDLNAVRAVQDAYAELAAKFYRETPAERYAREAKARLAVRVGENLAEEFTSVARSTELNAVNVAELMAAAYQTGLDSATREKS